MVSRDDYSLKVERWPPSQGATRGFTLHCFQRSLAKEIHWSTRLHKSHIERTASDHGFEMSVDGLLCILEACLAGEDVRQAYDVEDFAFSFNHVNEEGEVLWSEFYLFPSDSSRLEVDFELKFHLLDVLRQEPWNLSFNFKLSRVVSTPRQSEPLVRPPTMLADSGMKLAWWSATKKVNVLRRQLATEREAHTLRQKADARTVSRLRDLVGDLQSELARLQRDLNGTILEKARRGDSSMLPPPTRRASSRSSRASRRESLRSTVSLSAKSLRAPSESAGVDVDDAAVSCLRSVRQRKSTRKSVKLEEPFPTYKSGRRHRRRVQSLKSEKTRAETETEDV